MTLSVCCVTNDPGARVAAILSQLRPVAQEIVLAVDSRRLHGLVLALAQGVPAVAVDPISGGAKVLAQARALDWPASMAVDAFDHATLVRHFEWCLTPAARERARASVAAGLEDAAEIRDALVAYLGRT
jgi:hypothetical protein